MWEAGRDSGTLTRSGLFIFVLLLLSSCKSCLATGGNTLLPGQSISAGQAVISQYGTFELGFFTRGTSRNKYLGIWYKDFAEQIIVWVANRDKPLLNSSSKLQISEDGNLVLLNGTETFWSTNLILSTSNSVEAVLLDSGNFILRDGSRPSIIFWQSFDHPTDTWLPGAKLGTDRLTGQIQYLISWKNSEDPSPGLFSVGIDPGKNQYVAYWNMSRKYWSSGVWNGQVFSSVPELSYTSQFKLISNKNFNYSVYESALLSRIVMDMSGQLKQFTSLRVLQHFDLTWPQPRNESLVYAFCGAFGIFNDNPSTFCACLPGFEQFSENKRLNAWSAGCVRKTSLQCENKTSNGKEDGFMKISDVKLPADSKAYPTQSAKWYKQACMQNCSCTAYAYDNNGNGCSIWVGALLNVQNLSAGNNNKQDIYLKLAASELQNAGGNRKILWVTIPVLVSVTVLVSGSFICRLCMQKLKQKGEKDSSEDLLSFDFNCSSSATDDETNARNNLGRQRKKNIELPLFSFASVSAATGNFSAGNKLGEGGFGPVYKGTLLRGQEVAVKRLSKRSGQGLEEFRNEIVLIAKLQHRNLVRLLGFCIEQDENILIYEYLPNKSLDFFLFDTTKRQMIDWGTRIRIIEGIAQGILYLHHYSRVRIIHRDLKASNILLDSEMNPKISDFGMARIFGGNDSQGNTNRIVGTYGYMAPEYAMEGLFSTKADVFSFGVLLLETVSGKKNTGFYHSDSLNLLGHAWQLWNGDRALELVDQALDHPPSTTLLRYINIGLLCVQDNPTDRPSISNVVAMLSNELAPLPTPKQPVFSASRSVTNTGSSLSSAGNCSVNGLTISKIEPR